MKLASFYSLFSILTMEITLDQLALLLPTAQELFLEWLNDNETTGYEIDAILVGFLAAHEGIDYATAKDVYIKHIEPLLKSWELEETPTDHQEEFGL